MVRARSGGTQRLVIGWLCRPTGFRFAISTHLVLVDQLMFSVPNASAPLATRVFTQGPGPRQHRRRAQPASRESRLVVAGKRAHRRTPPPAGGESPDQDKAASASSITG